MPVMKTPGVYIVEQNAFPNSVVEVATAVPAFIGYTRRASNAGAPLTGRPFKILRRRAGPQVHHHLAERRAGRPRQV